MGDASERQDSRSSHLLYEAEAKEIMENIQNTKAAVVENFQVAEILDTFEKEITDFDNEIDCFIEENCEEFMETLTQIAALNEKFSKYSNALSKVES